MRIRIRIQLLFKCGSGSSLTKFVKKITLRRVFLHSRILIHKSLENRPRGKGNFFGWEIPEFPRGVKNDQKSSNTDSPKISGKFGLDRDQSHRAPWGQKHFPVRRYFLFPEASRISTILIFDQLCQRQSFENTPATHVCNQKRGMI